MPKGDRGECLDLNYVLKGSLTVTVGLKIDCGGEWGQDRNGNSQQVFAIIQEITYFKNHFEDNEETEIEESETEKDLDLLGDPFTNPLPICAL